MSSNPVFGRDKSSDFYNEINETLNSIECKNTECVADKKPASRMCFVTNKNGKVNFKVKDNICCDKFKKELEEKVNSIYQKYKE